MDDPVVREYLDAATLFLQQPRPRLTYDKLVRTFERETFPARISCGWRVFMAVGSRLISTCWTHTLRC